MPTSPFTLLLPGTTTPQAVIATARQFLNVPYSDRGAHWPSAAGYEVESVNCMTLFLHIAYRLTYLATIPDLRRHHPKQPVSEWQQGFLTANLDEVFPALPGDFLFLYPHHSAVYTSRTPGRGKILHASKAAGRVVEVELDAHVADQIRSIWQLRGMEGGDDSSVK